MGLPIHLLAVLAVSLVSPTVYGLHFSHGKTLVYKYFGDVKAGTTMPSPYASEFTLEGTLYMKHDTSDPLFTDAYYVALTNVKTGMYNGDVIHNRRNNILNPIDEAAKVLQQPFMILYASNGLFQGVQIFEDEPGWSKNMKMAMASMLQLDLTKIDVEAPNKRQQFISKENTIYGDCSVTYEVKPKRDQHPAKEFTVVKDYSPMNCTGFEVQSFDRVATDDCPSIKEEQLNVHSKRVVEIEKQGEEIIINKLFAQGGVDNLPWNHRTKAHYVLTKATFELERIVPVLEIDLPLVNMRNERLIRDVTYQKSIETYAPNAAVDLTHGRHVVNLDAIVSEVKKMLEEVVDYIEENHLDIENPDWKHGQIINRIMNTMSYMDIQSLELVFNSYRDSMAPRDITIKNFLFDIIPQVGTPATSIFTLSMLRKTKIMEMTVIAMLQNLALNVKAPTEKLLVQLEYLLKFDDLGSVGSKSTILCFSTLMYRTFKDLKHPEENALLQRYLHNFLDRVKNETNYETKVLYLMAIRNVEVGKIYDVLEPIITGDLIISENSVNIRLLAIWAIEKAIDKDYLAAEKLLWPIMADGSLPVKLRIAAYEILIHIPNEVLLLRIDSFIVMESNDHLYNYHYSTIKNILNSVDPCKRNLREHIRRIIRFNSQHNNIRYTLSATYSYDEHDDLFGVAEKLHGRLIFNELTGVPEVLQVEYFLAGGPEAVTDIGIRLHVQGLSRMIFDKFNTLDNPGSVTNPNVLEVLMKAARDLPPSENLYVDIVLLRKGRVVLANHYNRQTILTILIDVTNALVIHPKSVKPNTHLQSIEYNHLSWKHVTNDMGLPVVLDSRVPVVASLKFDNDINYNLKNFVTSLMFKVGFNLRIWKHGEYALSTYNPIADAWHAIRRTTALDASFPLKTNFSLGTSADYLKFNFPQDSATKFTDAAILQYVKDSVTVEAENGAEALNKSCSTCNLQEDVGIDDVEKAAFSGHFDSTVTGRRYSYSVTDSQLRCRIGEVPSARRKFQNEGVYHEQMDFRRKVKCMFFCPHLGKSSILITVKPSPVFGSTSVIIRNNGKNEYKGGTGSSYYILKSMKTDISFSADVISTVTNVPITSWVLRIIVDLDDDHLLNIVKLQLTKKVPGQKNYVICAHTQKSYPALPLDPLKLGVTKEETNSIVTIAVGYSDGDECVTDGTLVTMNMKGELSEEQKKKFDQDFVTGLCSKDMKNPLYATSKNVVPMSLNCLNEAITYTTLRKYTINVTLKRIPESLLSSTISYYDEYLRPVLSPYLRLNIEHLDTENSTIMAEFPMQIDEDYIKTETRLFGLRDINNDVAKPLWHYPLDNTRFSNYFLMDYIGDKMKMCVIAPRIIWTADHKSIPFNVPQQWILITGDHFNKNFAIFARTVGDKLSAKIYIESHQVVLFPRPDNGVHVMIDGQLEVDQLKEEVHLPATDIPSFIKVTRKNDLAIVEFNKVPSLSMVYSPDHITLTMKTNLLKGKLSGLCGRLDGNNITEVYTLA